ncbi:unnamed protein product [Oppiella nova]|uniref:Uncharacterized protein n=1 Tax=Oppiella nova TaxID=334625 RepID=A0A7R9MEC7_9ACAR|nr:unnamed protein product [Oppiella nova]CAG2174617.1 unnamed protein product [Oppiella nova]
MDAKVKCEPLVMKREATDEELEFRYDELTEALGIHTESESKANQTPVHWTPVQSNTGHTFANDLHSVDDVVGERDTELLMTGVPDYVMLGTNRTVAKGVHVTDIGVRMKRVPSNRTDQNKYHIFIPFSDMQRLSICTHPSLPLICIKPIESSCLKVREFIQLEVNSGVNSRRGFDIHSHDVREQNILIVMKEGMSATFAGLLADRCKRENRDCDCSPIGVTEAQVLLNVNTVFVKQEV